jgi:hypothetical protein
MDQLSADSPITNRNEDALGYWPFAESLAKGLTQRTPKDGFGGRPDCVPGSGVRAVAFTRTPAGLTGVVRLPQQAT